jgi:hypothetical protein
MDLIISTSTYKKRSSTEVITLGLHRKSKPNPTSILLSSLGEIRQDVTYQPEKMIPAQHQQTREYCNI